MHHHPVPHLATRLIAIPLFLLGLLLPSLLSAQFNNASSWELGIEAARLHHEFRSCGRAPLEGRVQPLSGMYLRRISGRTGLRLGFRYGQQSTISAPGQFMDCGQDSRRGSSFFLYSGTHWQLLPTKQSLLATLDAGWHHARGAGSYYNRRSFRYTDISETVLVFLGLNARIQPLKHLSIGGELALGSGIAREEREILPGGDLEPRINRSTVIATPRVRLGLMLAVSLNEVLPQRSNSSDALTIRNE